MADKIIYVDEDHSAQEIRNVSIEKLAATPGTLYAGRFWHNTTDNHAYFVDNDGTTVRRLVNSDDLNKFGEFIGSFSAAAGLVPTVGSGVDVVGTSDSSIEAGDSWRITVAGTITGLAAGNDNLAVGHLLLALVDGASTAADFMAITHNESIYSANGTVGTTRVATLTDTLAIDNSDSSDLILFDGTNKRVSIGGAAVSSAKFSVRAASSSTADVAFVFANNVGSRMLQGNAAGNISIGLGAPLTNTRLYVHSTNSSLFYGLNVIHSRNTGGSAVNRLDAAVGNAVVGTAYNYLNATGVGAYSRGCWGNSEGTLGTDNTGVYGNARNGPTSNTGVHGNTSGGGTTAVTTAVYATNINSVSLLKYGLRSVITSGPSASVNYGFKTKISPGTTAVSATLYGAHIEVDCNVSNTSLTQVGLFIDVNNRSHTTPVLTRAIHTQRGDIRFEDLSSTTSNIVVADSTGVLSVDSIPVFPVYTVATLPAVVAGGIIIVSDEIGGYTNANGDATNWRRASDGAIVA